MAPAAALALLTEVLRGIKREHQHKAPQGALGLHLARLSLWQRGAVHLGPPSRRSRPSPELGEGGPWTVTDGGIWPWAVAAPNA